jgi:hypothetical protein
LALTACAALENEPEDIEIPLDEVPGPVMEAAQSSLPGFVASEAEIEGEQDGEKVYELTGEADGIMYEIEITESGEILEVEQED